MFASRPAHTYIILHIWSNSLFKAHVPSTQRENALPCNHQDDSVKFRMESHGKSPDTEMETLELKRDSLIKQLDELKEKQKIKIEIKKLEDEIQALLKGKSSLQVKQRK